MGAYSSKSHSFCNISYIKNFSRFNLLDLIVYMGVNSSTPVTMTSAVANSIRQRIAQSTVVIYSKTHCPYCTMAKEVFNKINQPYDVIELNREADGDAIQDALGQMTGAERYPEYLSKDSALGVELKPSNSTKKANL